MNNLKKVLNIIKSNFPDLTDYQIKQFKDLTMLYENWNNKINVISRKDISELNTRHVLHSLSIAKIINFLPETKILDVGTGGGFPGIPLIVDGKFSFENKHQMKNGILYLKGGDLTKELKDFKHVKSFKINSYFKDTFFDTKKIVYLPMPYMDKDIH